jgi:hypothetical protein
VCTHTYYVAKTPEEAYKVLCVCLFVCVCDVCVFVHTHIASPRLLRRLTRYISTPFYVCVSVLIWEYISTYMCLRVRV